MKDKFTANRLRDSNVYPTAVEIHNLILSEFNFLVTEYKFEKCKYEREEVFPESAKGFGACLRNNYLKVLVEYDIVDRNFMVWLLDLNGDLLVSLPWLIWYRCREVDPRIKFFKYPKNIEETIDFCKRYARALKVVGNDILAGDFSDVPKIKDAVDRRLRHWPTHYPDSATETK
jgi:hypothetical protein